jgi:N-acetylmuramoyl-L-alanine amidase
MKNRIFITAAVCFILIFSLSVSALAVPEDSVVSSDSELTVTLDGTALDFDTAPARIDSDIDSDIYVPMLEFCDKMGAKVLKWDDDSQSALAIFRQFAIDASADSSYITANGRCLYADGGCVMQDGVLMVPLSTLAAALDAYVQCDLESGIVSISSGSGMIESGDDFYDEENLYWLARIIWAEAGSESFLGKVAVGNVVMNRVKSSGFPDTVYGVVFDRSCGVQFEPILNGTIYNDPTADCYAAAKLALEGASPVGDCLFFASISDCWAAYNRPYYGKIGRHYFYL